MSGLFLPCWHKTFEYDLCTPSQIYDTNILDSRESSYCKILSCIFDMLTTTSLVFWLDAFRKPVQNKFYDDKGWLFKVRQYKTILFCYRKKNTICF
jgi:hypothetical protein